MSRKLIESQNPDHDEFVEIAYLPLEEAVDMARRSENEDSKSIIALLFAERRINDMI